MMIVHTGEQKRSCAPLRGLWIRAGRERGTLVECNRVVADGLGAAPVAVALLGKAGDGKVVCIVSGGNIDTDKLLTILQGNIP